MTSALGWGLANSSAFLRAFLGSIGLDPGDADPPTIRLQQHDVIGGFTDIELVSASRFHVIVEAKRGWWLPGPAQLSLYASRFGSSGATENRLVVLTQWGAESAARHAIAGMGLTHRCLVLGWSDVLTMVRRSRRSTTAAGRLWLDQLDAYLREVTDMRDTDSNRVYVVSLSHESPPGWPMDFVDVVQTHERYFFPADGKRWPKEPPNYIAFRFGGRLQSIHHVDDYVIETDLSRVLPVPSAEWPPYFVLTLGPAIRPPVPVPTGARIHRSARVWVDIDLLLTSPTISDALTATVVRRP